jgi:hypothetical protein
MLIEGTTSAELRDKCMRERFVPLAREMFARMPEVQCIAYTIGQYFCDEAEDAVHEEIATFLEREPKWPDAFDQEADEARKERAFATHVDGFDEFVDNLPTLDDNSSAITAFASHCREPGDQEQPFTESHVVYAWARRGVGGELVLDVVGTMFRPEWEDRFDVGLGDEDGEGGAPLDVRPTAALPGANRPTSLVPPARVPRPAPQARGLWAFLRRLFGG